MVELVLNLTQHPATAEQVAAGVVDLPAAERAHLVGLLTIDALPSSTELAARAHDIALLAHSNGLGGDDADDPVVTHAMIGGAPFLMGPLEAALVAQGIAPLYAFSRRVVREVVEADGTVRKVSEFRHEGFIAAT